MFVHRMTTFKLVTMNVKTHHFILQFSFITLMISDLKLFLLGVTHINENSFRKKEGFEEKNNKKIVFYKIFS